MTTATMFISSNEALSLGHQVKITMKEFLQSTAVIDCTDVGPKIAFQVESIGASCSETSGCNTATSGPCF